MSVKLKSQTNSESGETKWSSALYMLYKVCLCLKHLFKSCISLCTMKGLHRLYYVRAPMFRLKNEKIRMSHFLRQLYILGTIWPFWVTQLHVNVVLNLPTHTYTQGGVRVLPVKKGKKCALISLIMHIFYIHYFLYTDEWQSVPTAYRNVSSSFLNRGSCREKSQLKIFQEGSGREEGLLWYFKQPIVLTAFFYSILAFLLLVLDNRAKFKTGFMFWA